MSQRIVRVDDHTGAVSADANPAGWLNVIVSPIGAGATPINVDFQGWTSFRHWVELSDPGCGRILNPPVATGP